MTDKCTPEEARKIVEDSERPENGLASQTDPSSGIVMKASKADPSVLTYDPEDVEIDKDVQKRAKQEAEAAKK